MWSHLEKCSKAANYTADTAHYTRLSQEKPGLTLTVTEWFVLDHLPDTLKTQSWLFSSDNTRFRFCSTKVLPFSSQAWRHRLVILALRRQGRRIPSSGGGRKERGKVKWRGKGWGFSLQNSKRSGLGTLKRKPTSALVLSTSIRYRILVYGDEVLWVLGTHLLFHPLLDIGSCCSSQVFLLWCHHFPNSGYTALLNKQAGKKWKQEHY